MRKLLNTLYVTTPEAYLTRDGFNVVVKVDNKELFRIPIHNIEGIVTFGYCGATPSLIQLCATNNVALTFLSIKGHFMGRILGEINGNVLLRKKQYAISEHKEEALHISRLIVAAKLYNSRYVVQRHIRDYGDNQTLAKASHYLDESRARVLESDSADSLRGIEGEAANCYFSIFNCLLTDPNCGFVFNGRSKRPPKDEINALLSFCYTLLAHDIQSALETVGLDPYVGFLHTDRPGRISLALDLMEEFRSYIVDRFVLSLINRKQIVKKDFIAQTDESYLLSDTARKNLITAWQKRKQDTITHPYLNEKIPIGLLPYSQAMLLARYLRGDIDDYPVFLAK